MRAAVRRYILTGLLLLFLIPWYYWGLLPLTIGYAYFGVLLAGAVTTVGILAVPPQHRLSVVAQALTFIFLFKGWHSLEQAAFSSGATLGKVTGILEGAAMVVLLFFLGRWTARIAPGRWALILVLSLTAFALPGSWLYEAPHLLRVWSWGPLQPARTDNIPQVAFVPSPNGGMDLAVAAEAPGPPGPGVSPLTAGRVFHVWQWQGHTFQPAAGLASQVAAAVRPDPTYLPVARPSFELGPEGVGYALKLRLGPAAAAGLALNASRAPAASLAQAAAAASAANSSWNRLQAAAGNLPAGPQPALDLLPAWRGAPYGLTGVVLHPGRLTGAWQGRPFSWPTKATRIVGAGRLTPSSRPDLVLQGPDISVVQLGARPRLLFRITDSASLPDVARVQVRLARIGPGPAVLLLNDLENKAAVVGYAGGTASGYRILWVAPDHTFRFQSAGLFGAGDQPVVLALDKAPVPTLVKVSYLEALRWNGRSFASLWHIYLPQILFARLAPLQGAGSEDLVMATLYGNSVGVFRPQTLPLTTLTDVATLGLVAGAWLWRLASSKRSGES